jgi:CRP-like cAMP-binding protein
MPCHAYFLSSGFASVVVAFADGESAEVGLIGNEGVVGAYQLLGRSAVATTCFMQVAGAGWSIPFADLRREFAESEEVRTAVLEFVQGQTTTLAQVAACNKLHEAEARLARWLLMAQDRVGVDTLPLTQELLAQMLGTRRTTVALVAGTMERAGLIEWGRGKVHIVNREKLEAAACDCYLVVKRAMDLLYIR